MENTEEPETYTLIDEELPKVQEVVELYKREK